MTNDRTPMRWIAFGWRCPVCEVTVMLPKHLGPIYCPVDGCTPRCDDGGAA